VRPQTTRELRTLEAVILLQQARDKLKEAKAPRALEKVRSALKSAEGALRHAHGRAFR
jgi:hypothetical protein